MLQIAVSISGTQLEVWVDCRRIYRRVVPPPLTNFTTLAAMDPPYDPAEPIPPQTKTSVPGYGKQSMSLFLGQRNLGHFLFRVRNHYNSYNFNILLLSWLNIFFINPFLLGINLNQFIRIV